MVVTPYYNKPSQEGLYRHYRAVAEATKLPVLLYSVPSRCGVEIGTETARRLAADCTNVVAIKEAGNGDAREARLLHERFYPLHKELFVEPNPVPTKTALALMKDWMTPDLRLPLCEMSKANFQNLRRVLSDLELIKA